jgi:ADP-ribosyl-[dinitrogen reductase] hydrolase
MWFYSPPRDVIGAFGEVGVTGYAAPPTLHPTNSLMADFWKNNRENVRDVVGKVILHGKEALWQQKQVHYHAGLSAGENTLNAQLLRVLLRTTTASISGYSPTEWLKAYAEFMTTPGSHNDSFLLCPTNTRATSMDPNGGLITSFL